MVFERGEKLLYIHYTPHIVHMTQVVFSHYATDYLGITRCLIIGDKCYYDESNLWSKDQVLALFDDS